MDFDKNLEKVNQRLKAGNIRLQIQKQGNTLYLRGMFPPKNATREEILAGVNWYQQRLALKVKATPTGLKFAEAKAKEIAALLDLKQFSWEKYLPTQSEYLSITNCIEKFKLNYFSTRAKSEASLSTWDRDYFRPLIALPNKAITLDLLREHILSTEPDTRNRRRYALACAKLADFLGLEHNLRDLVGNYGIKCLSPRSLPDDNAIATLIDKFDSCSWRWVYGMMACYGLRNHEIFAIDLDDFPIAFVNRGKSGERYVWPLFPEWADQWNLSEVKLPVVTGRNNSERGNKVTKAFEKYNIPFSPYNLRHAWAVRSLEFGLDISLASAQMGHSVAVHSKIYHHWITRDVHQRAMNLILSNPNRPKPPICNSPVNDFVQNHSRLL